MARLRPDFASGKLSAGAVTNSQTTLNSAQFAPSGNLNGLPVVSGGNVVELVLDPYGLYGTPERVIVTAHVNATDTVVTVTRGAYGSTARAHNQGGIQEDWCAAITDQDFVHATLTSLSSDDHPQYYGPIGGSDRHQAVGAHAVPAILNDIFYAGLILPFGGANVPSGWLACDGSTYSRTTYANLYNAIGTNWGVGDGSTTFAVPDLRGRTMIGAGTGGTLTNRTLGTTLGEEVHTLTTAELASHTHPMAPSNRLAFAASNSGEGTVNNSNGTRATYANPDSFSTDASGLGSGHNNMQPSAAVTFMIKY